jgi:hypothetical protein
MIQPIHEAAKASHILLLAQSINMRVLYIELETSNSVLVGSCCIPVSALQETHWRRFSMALWDEGDGQIQRSRSGTRPGVLPIITPFQLEMAVNITVRFDWNSSLRLTLIRL